MANKEPFDLKAYIAKNAYKNRGKTLVVSIVFSLVCLIVVAFGLIDGLMMAIAAAGGLAFLLGAHMEMESAIEGGTPSNKELYKGFVVYATRNSPYFGCYRYFMCLLKALAAYMAVNASLSYVYVFATYRDNMVFYEQIVSSFLSGELDVFIGLLESDVAFVDWFVLSSNIALILAAYEFIHEVAKQVIGTTWRQKTAVFGPRNADKVFNSFFRQHKKEVLKDHYSANWPFIVAFASSVGIGVAFVLISGVGWGYFVVASLALFAVGSVPFLTIFTVNADGMAIKYNKEINKEILSMCDEVEAMAKQQGMGGVYDDPSYKDFKEKLKDDD